MLRNAGILAVTSPAPRELWQAVYESDPEALPEHSPAWIDLLCSEGAYADSSRLYELGDGRLGVLPMVRRRLPGGLGIEASLPPAWGRGGLIASGGARASDISAVFADVAARRALRTSLRPNPLAGAEYAAARPPRTVSVPRLAHVLDLEGGFGQVWTKRFTKGARRQVRRAERAGLSVECDTSGRLVPAFYRLFELSLDRWASQQHEPRALAHWRARSRDPERKLQAMADALGDHCRIWVASLEGCPVASIVVIQGPNAHYTRGAMDKEPAGRTFANYLIQQLAIEDACNAGCRHYHMGESGRSASLALFKTRFGAAPYEHADYHIERLPITALDRRARTIVKHAIGFRDVSGRAS